MKISLRGWLIIGAFAAIVVGLAVSNTSAFAADPPAKLKAGQLSEESLGNLLLAMGLEPKKVDKRYDFTFKALHNKEEWDLSMTTVLSQDGSAIWVMAWLDELPRSAADVPRTALLRLLANNDQLGNGKFFAYVASNRRFVLQRVIINENISTGGFRAVLQDLGGSVADTYPHWAVANWKPSDQSTTAQTPTTNSSKAGTPQVNPLPGRAPTRSAVNDSKFKAPVRK